MKLGFSNVIPSPKDIENLFAAGLDEDVEKAFDEIRSNNKEGSEELTETDFVSAKEETEKTAEEYARMKGIEVNIPRRNSPPVKGKLVDWKDPANYRVVWFDGFTYLFKSIKADELKKMNPFLEGSLAIMQASGQSRMRLSSLFEDAVLKPIKGMEINNGGQAETLEEAIHTFELPGGIEGVAATSKAGYKYETEKDATGKEAPKDRNDDVWLVDTENSFVAVIDGLGGGKKGTRAAEIVATSIAENEANVAQGAKAAQVKLSAEPGLKSADGAVFLSAKIEVGKPIEVNQAGDVDLYHFDAKGKAKYSPSDYPGMGQPPQSLLDQIERIDQLKLPAGVTPQRAIQIFAEQAAKKMTPEEKAEGIRKLIKNYEEGVRPIVEISNPLYVNMRRAVMMGIDKEKSAIASYQTKSPVEEGDWVLLMSDGVSDNFPPGDLEMYVARAIRGEWTPEQLTKRLSQILDERIKLKADNDPMAEKKHYKLDNATIIVMRVKGQQAQAVKDEIKAA